MTVFPKSHPHFVLFSVCRDLFLFNIFLRDFLKSRILLFLWSECSDVGRRAARGRRRLERGARVVACTDPHASRALFASCLQYFFLFYSDIRNVSNQNNLPRASEHHQLEDHSYSIYEVMTIHCGLGVEGLMDSRTYKIKHLSKPCVKRQT